MLENKVVLTEEGRRRIEAELEYLRTVRRREITARIREALSLGDAWENAEYETAKEEQAFNEGRIRTLESLLLNATVIRKEAIKSRQVEIGTTVRIQDLQTGDDYVYQIVGSTEADPSNHKISYKAPVAQGLLHREVGDIIQVEVPCGIVEYRVLEIL